MTNTVFHRESMTSKADPFTVSSSSEPAGRQRSGFARHAVESLLFLAIAVMTCRVFLAEGFMISTGSMAPTLLGYHRQVVCPDCGYHFARGARYPDEVNWPSEAVAQDLVGNSSAVASTVCPNCLSTIDASAFPVNEGDQLMVHKYAYDFRDPHRWEVVVFRNPEDTTQPYVKRVAGLPGEVVEIQRGDIYADGQLQRKPLDVQRALRILVDDHDHQPHDADPNTQPRWFAVQADTSSWNSEDRVITFAGLTDDEERSTDAPDFDWLAFRHWIREGGSHESQVSLTEWPAGLSPAAHLPDNVSYDADRQLLICVGTLEWDDYQRAVSRDDSTAWRQAWDRLFTESHSPPVSDTYGYNHPQAADRGYFVRDIMVSGEVSRTAGEGIFIMRLTDGSAIFDCEFDFGHREVRLYANNLPDPLRVVPLPDEMFDQSALIEMSNFDRQLSVAIDGAELFDPVRYATDDHPDETDVVSLGNSSSEPAPPRHPVLLGAENLSLSIVHLQVYRDVYYTPKGESPYRYELEDDEFFVLGDNSPISSDSRAWDDPAITRDLLIGKPLIVHLPSQQWQLNWGGEPRYVRIPDPSRVRWIR